MKQSRYVEADVARKAHIRTLYLFICVLFVVCGLLWYGWQTAPQHLRISIPPDLRDGAIVKPGEFQAATVFAFAMTTLRELNRWEENGYSDYGTKIKSLQHRFTPSFKEYLLRDMNIKNERGELKDRVRYTLEVPGMSLYEKSLVTSNLDGSWTVSINVEIVERVASMEAKRVAINYPIRVVQMNITPDKNIWGLALDGYTHDKRPTKIDFDEITAKR